VGDRWGAAAVRGLGETVEKETARTTTETHHLQRDGKCGNINKAS